MVDKTDEYTEIERKTIEIVDQALMTWNKPHLGDSKDNLIYKSECYFSTLKEIQSLFFQTSIRSKKA